MNFVFSQTQVNLNRSKLTWGDEGSPKGHGEDEVPVCPVNDQAFFSGVR